jgi:YD repeat-containing protein
METTTKSIFNSKGEIISMTGTDGITINYTYNKNGDKLSEEDSNGVRIDYIYNKRNILTNMIRNGVNVSVTDDNYEYTYNENGDIISEKITDKKGKIYTKIYDENGNLTKIIYPDGAEKLYGYCKHIQVTSLNDGSEKTEVHYFRDNEEFIPAPTKQGFFARLFN